jgi:hypothetical protein
MFSKHHLSSAFHYLLWAIQNCWVEAWPGIAERGQWCQHHTNLFRFGRLFRIRLARNRPVCDDAFATPGTDLKRSGFEWRRLFDRLYGCLCEETEGQCAFGVSCKGYVPWVPTASDWNAGLLVRNASKIKQSLLKTVYLSSPLRTSTMTCCLRSNPCRCLTNYY